MSGLMREVSQDSMQALLEAASASPTSNHVLPSIADGVLCFGATAATRAATGAARSSELSFWRPRVESTAVSHGWRTSSLATLGKW